jgi:hypothetical protein
MVEQDQELDLSNVPHDLKHYVEAHLTEKARRAWPDGVVYLVSNGNFKEFVFRRGDGVGVDEAGPKSVSLGFKLRDAKEKMNLLVSGEKARVGQAAIELRKKGLGG